MAESNKPHNEGGTATQTQNKQDQVGRSVTFQEKIERASMELQKLPENKLDRVIDFIREQGR